MNQIKRIRLVEDDPQDVELTLTALDEYRLTNRMDVVRDGAEGLDYLDRRGKFQTRDRRNPAVVILDLKLPKVSGLQVLRQVKADEELRLVPFVVLTSSQQEQDLIVSYQFGVNAYVVKPVDFHKFVEAIKTRSVVWAVLNESSLGALLREPKVPETEASA